MDHALSDGVLIVDGAIKYLTSQQFCSMTGLKKVVVGKGITFMEEEVFAECPDLEEVILPEGLINIGIAAFSGCTSLSKIIIPDTVKSIDDGAFLGCTSLTSIELPESLESIAQLAFEESGLERISIPKTVKEIGEEAFFECVNLRSVNVLGKNTVIGENAFGSNYSLIEGYIAPGYSQEDSRSAELLYSLLWCTCPDKHTEITSERAKRFIQANEELVIERILKADNIPAMTGIVEKELLNKQNIDRYVCAALDIGASEITALLIKAKGNTHDCLGDFEL